MTSNTAIAIALVIVIMIIMFMMGVVGMPGSSATSTGFATTSWLGTIKTVTGF